MDYSNITASQAQRLIRLNERIAAANIPQSSLDQSLNVATWNIRNFGKAKRYDDGILFIAQILYQFDLIAITEVRDDLTDFKRVLQLLGPQWKFVISDWQPDRGGNQERIAFLYDERIVSFTGLAAEASPARTKAGSEYTATQSWWRYPYFASFQAGHFDFIILAMHARWGAPEGRLEELASFGDWISRRWDDHQDRVFDKDVIVVGDFNIKRIDDEFYRALTDRSKLKMPRALAGVQDTATSPGNKNYDQILHRCQQTAFTDNGGIIDFASDGFMENVLFPDLPASKVTYELSDHFPLWVQLNTDNDDFRLTTAADVVD
ncbi:hypothetical protein GCM10011369_11860 [Neiella marina]|uniref:Endonuclease/exonuclease/phosphatase domain-containing protein n=1 Tax=Neiella marina TaxID=508461 RepID=A0A8J2XNG3_9GAMM|nr:endonuclease/exonuclease/phosphatase family protein [Neiella marina]GGA71694.1 hypothetical protein GCM10011369_11860 [Neiella marina]